MNDARKQLGILLRVVRYLERQALHPVRTARGWLFDPADVAAGKAKRPLRGAAAPASEGRIAVARRLAAGR